MYWVVTLFLFFLIFKFYIIVTLFLREGTRVPLGFECLQFRPACLCDCLERDRTHRMCVLYTKRKVYFKGLAHGTKGADGSEICRVSWQVGDPGEGWCWSLSEGQLEVEFCLPRRILVFSHKAFKWLDEPHGHSHFPFPSQLLHTLPPAPQMLWSVQNFHHHWKKEPSICVCSRNHDSVYMKSELYFKASMWPWFLSVINIIQKPSTNTKTLEIWKEQYLTLIYILIRFILKIIYIMAYCLHSVIKGVSRNDPWCHFLTILVLRLQCSIFKSLQVFFFAA